MKTKRAAKGPSTPKASKRSIDAQVEEVLDWLRKHATKATLQGMSRYAIPSDHAFGVAMKDIKALGKRVGQNHDLALALWNTGHYEARILTSFVADPGALTAAQMERWCRDFDNWAYCDTLSFHLFDRSPHAWAKAKAWCTAKGEFQKRTAFALLWSLALHDKKASDAQFVEALGWIERAADDDRNFVKKAVNMALRAIGRRKPLRGAVTSLAARLGESSTPSARWIGKEVLRELKSR
jgi:3-methyladenine DNA glycosylase AlkD